MSFPLAETIGSLAATLTTLSFLPQVIKTWRTRSAPQSFTRNLNRAWFRERR